MPYEGYNNRVSIDTNPLSNINTISTELVTRHQSDFNNAYNPPNNDPKKSRFNQEQNAANEKTSIAGRSESKQGTVDQYTSDLNRDLSAYEVATIEETVDKEEKENLRINMIDDKTIEKDKAIVKGKFKVVIQDAS